MMKPRMQPLRIPAGWKVTYRDFWEVETTEDAAETGFLKEDLLQIRNENKDLLLDVGWYPDGDPSGSYVLFVYRGDFTGTLLVRTDTKDHAEVVEAIEKTLVEYGGG